MSEPDERDLETPEADAAEQQTDWAEPEPDDDSAEAELPVEVDPADRAEQARAVGDPLDDEDR